jgi:3-oxoadipate enol-lactonase
MKIKSGDTEIECIVRGEGAPVVLLHPFPLNHQFWNGCLPFLEDRYRLILPDLRGHGDSMPGEGPATMEKHARDIARVCDELGIGKAVFAGVSIGGYILFECWRQFRERISALILANTRAAAETAEGRANRLKSIEAVQQKGPTPFIEELIPRLVGQTTLSGRLDRVETVRAMMARMSVPGIVAIQQGMADRPDSIPTLRMITAPTLIIAGAEDNATPLAEAEVMHRGIAGSRLEIVERGGHYAAFEQPEEFGRLMRVFLDKLAIGN